MTAPKCSLCDGTGKRAEWSFSTPKRLIERTCSVCRGRGYLDEDVEYLRKEIDRLRAIEAAAKDWLKAHDAHLALYAKGDANFHELDATVAKRTEARERLRKLVGEG